MGITHFGLNLFDLAGGVRVSKPHLVHGATGGGSQQHTLSTVVAMVATSSCYGIGLFPGCVWPQISGS
jgi:hypothetical protein